MSEDQAKCLCKNLELLRDLASIYNYRSETDENNQPANTDTEALSTRMLEIANAIYDAGKSALSEKQDKRFQLNQKEVAWGRPVFGMNPVVVYLDHLRAKLHDDKAFRRAFLCQKADECTICEVDDALYLLGETDLSEIAIGRIEAALRERGCKFPTDPVIESPNQPPESVRKFYLLKKMAQEEL